MSTLRSPNEVHNAAINIMLNGRKPRTREDWQRCVNFWASNIADGLEIEACILMGLIMECPLSESDIRDIAIYQQGVKAGGRHNGN